MIGFVALCTVVCLSLVAAGPVVNRTGKYDVSDLVSLIEQGFQSTAIHLQKLRDEVELNRKGIAYISGIKRGGIFIEKLRQSVRGLTDLDLTVRTNETGIVMPPLECGDGWSKHDGRCFKFAKNCTRPCSGNGAKAFCEKQGGFLASVLSADDEKYFIAQIRASKNIFLGGNDRAKEGKWVWADGSPVQGYTNWASGEPNQGRSGNCLCIGDSPKKWYDFACTPTWSTARHSFVCERLMIPGPNEP